MSEGKINEGGLIERISKAGIEREELKKDAPRALVGGARIPYRPQDLASIITLLAQRNPKRYLALEIAASAALEFIQRILGGLYLNTILEHNDNEKDLRTHLRRLKGDFDVITIDGRGLKVDASTLWRYLEGGKEPPVLEFGKGAQVDYGSKNFKAGSVIVLNLVDPDTKALYFRLRTRYTPMYASPYVGVVRI